MMQKFDFLSTQLGVIYLPTYDYKSWGEVAYAHVGDSGFDLRAAIATEVSIEPGERALIKTGLKFELEVGTEMQIRSRSGLSYKHALVVLNQPGTIDQSYKGEVGVILINLGRETYVVKPGERIAQAVMCPVLVAEFRNITEAPNEETSSTRGSGGFGSTGV